MSDPSFEQTLTRLFAEPPPLADHARFTAAIQARLERGWALRRILIGFAGVVGGLIAAAQVLSANLVERVSFVSRAADHHARDVADALVLQAQASVGTHLAPLGGEVVWMVAGLAVVGAGLVAARMLEAL